MIEDHGHCEICARTVAWGDRFCGREECDKQHLQNLRDKKRQVYMFVALIAGVMMLSVLLR